MNKNPYAGKPDHQFWRRSVSGRAITDVDPVARAEFSISADDAIATAGSCFAQHIARTLSKAGFNYFVSEKGPATPAATAESYSVYSARYGNVYTVRQLWQLFRRAYGLFDPVDSAWKRKGGGYVDPFRPQVQSAGFSTIEGLVADRESHLLAVRRVFEECRVFIFTLGLTEGWESHTDGAVFPLAPGVVSHDVDERNYKFHNFNVHEMELDMARFIAALRKVNPRSKIILTVSPVSLLATYEDDHVLTATVYSKAALRVVAESTRRNFENVSYFPSFEIITGPHSRGIFFEQDAREVTPAGVAHVMSIFTRHYIDNTTSVVPAVTTAFPGDAAIARQLAAMNEVQKIICDEEQIEVSR